LHRFIFRCEGNLVQASYYGMSGNWPLELLVTVTFEEHESKTKITLQHVGILAGKNRDLAKAGWNESFKKLAKYLEKEKFIMGKSTIEHSNEMSTDFKGNYAS
jgi:hypothetical protein